MRTMQCHRAVMPQEVHVRAGSVFLEGELDVPEGARGVVLFLHGSGSSRHSPRDRTIEVELHKKHFATFLVDLLTTPEEAVDIQNGQYRYDVAQLARRVGAVTDSLGRDPLVRDLPRAYLATGTGAAAALMAAAENPSRVNAIISRGGRPDLAEAALARVATPTLLIAGSQDHDTLKVNQEAFATLRCIKEFQVIAGAGHLFEEPGAIEAVEALIVAWLQRHLRRQLVAT